MMRRAGERLRTSWATLLRGELDGVRAELATSWTSSFDELRHDIASERADVEARVTVHDMELVNALHRVAVAFENIATALDADRRDRREQLDAIEFLLREMVLGFAPATAIRPTVLGGTLAPGPVSRDAVATAVTDVDIDLSDGPIPVDTFVEVRSRFHDHWVHGFAIAEYIPGPARRGYRLRRLTDTEQLPLLFDAADVRRATVPIDHPVGGESVEPEPSMWR